MLRAVAFVLVQLKLAVWLGPILLGVAVRVTPRILMVAEACTVTPEAPVAVAVYVVLAVGTTVAEPESASEVTSSPRMEGAMVTAVALVLAQERVAFCPEATTPGEAFIVIVGAEPAATTVTVRENVTVRPCASAAVATYVVVCDGETVAWPVMGSGLVPTDGEIENVLAFVTCQESVVLCP